MSLHEHTHLEQTEGVPDMGCYCQMFISQSGMLAGWLGSLSGCCMAAGLIPAGVKASLHIYISNCSKTFPEMQQTELFSLFL